jgi:hypothetical protein
MPPLERKSFHLGKNNTNLLAKKFARRHKENSLNLLSGTRPDTNYMEILMEMKPVQGGS